MAADTTYHFTGNREDLTNIITNISPVDTWFSNKAGKTKASGTYHEWQTDTLRAAAANKHVEGAATSENAVTATSRLGNYTQIVKEAFKITKTQEVVDKAGRKSEMAYQTMKYMKFLAKDIEYALLFNSASASGASGTARQALGFDGFVTTNVETGSATGTQALDEDMFNDALQMVWAQGGMPQTCIMGAFQKRKVSGFTTNTRYMVADENKLASAVDVYQSDFGTVQVRLHHEMNTTASDKVFIFGDMTHWQLAWLRGIKKERQPFAGDAELWEICGELTLESRQEAGHGKITQLTTS